MAKLPHAARTAVEVIAEADVARDLDRHVCGPAGHPGFFAHWRRGLEGFERAVLDQYDAAQRAARRKFADDVVRTFGPDKVRPLP